MTGYDSILKYNTPEYCLTTSMEPSFDAPGNSENVKLVNAWHHLRNVATRTKLV